MHDPSEVVDTTARIRHRRTVTGLIGEYPQSCLTTLRTPSSATGSALLAPRTHLSEPSRDCKIRNGLVDAIPTYMINKASTAQVEGSDCE
jgi:hypothetical protein